MKLYINQTDACNYASAVLLCGTISEECSIEYAIRLLISNRIAKLPNEKGVLHKYSPDTESEEIEAVQEQGRISKNILTLQQDTMHFHVSALAHYHGPDASSPEPSSFQ
ncbi:hypothetical protein CEXT_73871 [Caerostris extrusa]|uniref:Uncharacterized protein n=1 Tax=Caerostris extrusa TaxID=172846 RepID=A0AAV4P8D6_CAEEX|nr:hypothetical protein CEXT_73871 [Caerostris extrusa]